jgi:transcriptional regulator with PAS, ATPase and Fis domain
MDRATLQKKFGLIGTSDEIREIADVVLQVAPTDLSVLITGESGTGKEVIAKALHGASGRSQKPMVSVNCGAIPEGLMESELFGHERGAFTSAVEQRKGYFEIADGSTIFLDEIGETPLATQVKLLRVLESGEYMRVGASTARHANVRVIAATNKTLEYEVQQKRFRSDLYFRLRSVNIHLPPLRNRRGDIPALVDQFVQDVVVRNGLVFGGFTDEATSLLMSYHWPGNVRQLRNLIESVIVLERGRRLTADDVQKHLQETSHVVAERNLPVVSNRTVEQAERELIYRALLDLKGNILELRDIMSSRLGGESTSPAEPEHRNGNGAVSLDEMERRLVMDALDRHHGNRRLAAKDLHISERTLYRKIKDYGLQ